MRLQVIKPLQELFKHHPEGFCCVISMYDGVVLYTTPSLTNLLGFPKDMWLGRSFIDFVHPKDRETFSAQVTTGITIPLTDSAGKNMKNSFYVFLRKYKGLKTTGFGVVEKTVSYQAFQLTATFRHINDSQETKHSSSIGGIFLIIVAVPVTSSFKAPNEEKNLPKFNMHHTAASTVTYVDSDIVKNFGFMPQDILGRSVFDFYHPEDMPLLKEVYEAALSQCQIAGAVYRSKPYRFAVQNGGFATIETDWSCFFNPWSRKLEIVIGMHNILKGPSNPDVFGVCKEKEINSVSEEILKKGDIVREEILRLLNHERTKPTEEARQEVTKRCKDLTKFIEKVMSEVARPNVKTDSPENSSVSVLDREFVVLGEVSPHNDYYDQASSETPPSYYQLNYNENIHRFFESKPRTKTSEEGGQPSTGPDSEQEGKSVSPAHDDSMGSIGKSYSPIQNRESRSGSGNLSSASNVNMETVGTSGNGSNDSYNSPHLTEALLSKHNKEMEKIMRKRYREYRSTVKEKDGKLYKNNKKTQMVSNAVEKNDRNPNCVNHPHGVKRSGSRSWEGDHHKITKHKHQINLNPAKGETGTGDNNNFNNLRTPQDTLREENYYMPQINDTNLWPPFSLSVTPVNNSYTFTRNEGVKNNSGFAGLFPVYFVPTQSEQPPIQNTNDTYRPSPVQVQYMPSMMYNCQSVFPTTSSIFCPPMAFVPLPFQQPSQPPPQKEVIGGGHPTSCVDTSNMQGQRSSLNSNPFLRRSSSQVTSIKVEPGSGIGSVTSASCLNKAISDCSRKDFEMQSGSSQAFSIIDTPVDGPSVGNYKTTESNQLSKMPEMQESDGTGDGSSHSSLYSSFLKTTDPGSDPNDNSSASDNRNASSNNFYKKPTVYPVRNRDPPWLETVSVTPDLIYRYQVSQKTMDEILKSDMNSLKGVHQPTLVNDQLDQLYVEMELQGLSSRLTLEEGITSSSSTSSCDETSANQQKMKKKRKSYSSLVMIYEENAPFPSPDSCGGN
ncbi:period circadian protein-like isoform X3 [Agrilus planipennis]|uniref:Period circadian protein n=2 Tax=Agrilus planipennis TaxID=224129 RepID=A0A7F5RJ86_AGRPL|nr:period circadian protein-like isoform X3 [Agrilus planipennis]